VARALHQASPRRFHPLVVIHCGALTETLLESETLSDTRKALSLARQYRKKGKFEIAEGGTVTTPGGWGGGAAWALFFFPAGTTPILDWIEIGKGEKWW